MLFLHKPNQFVGGFTESEYALRFETVAPEVLGQLRDALTVASAFLGVGGGTVKRRAESFHHVDGHQFGPMDTCQIGRLRKDSIVATFQLHGHADSLIPHTG